MCNRIQGRTPVFGSCLVLILRCCWMLSAVCYWRSIWCFWCGPDGHVVLLSLSSVGGYGLFLSFVVSEMDHGLLRSINFGFWGGSLVLCWHCLGSVGGLFLRWILLVSSSEPSLADQISAWGRLWSMNSWVMASMMNYLIKNISELFIVLYDHIAIYSESARPTFSKADTETDCSSQKLHMFRHGFPLPSLSTGWPGFGGKRIGFAF